MPDFYSQHYENAGPLARPVIQRSQYLADALAAMRQDSSHINNGGQLAARLLAQALGQWAQHRQEGRLAKAQALDTQDMAAPGLAGISEALAAYGGQQAAPAPAMASPPPAPEQQAMPPADPLYNYHAKTDDLAARLLARESASHDGRVAAGNVIRQRGSTGMDLADVMTQRSQFEPLGRSRAETMSMSTTDPRYQDALRAWQESATNQVAPPGADHFYGPESQRQLSLRDGRPVVPDFARGGGGVNIGGNEFFARGFSPPSGYQMTPPVPMTDQAQPAPAPTPPATGGGAPPAGPMPSTGQAGGSPFAQPSGLQNVATEQELRYLQSEMQSGNMQRIAAATQRWQALQQAAMAPVQYRYSDPTATGQVVRSGGGTAPTAIDVAGFNPGMETTTINGVPAQRRRGSSDPWQVAQIPAGAQTQTFGNFQPGTVVNRSPTGNTTVAQAPQTPREPPVTFRPTTPEEERQYGGPGQMDSRGQFHATAQRALTGPLLNLESRDMEAVNTASNVLSLLQTQAQRIDNGQLHLGPLTNALQSGRNMVGQSDQASANFADFNAARDQIRNQSLRLNPGVQTEGDAIRATNELFANTNDQRVVRQRLAAAIQQYRRIQDQRLAQINLRRRQNGLAPYTLQDIEGTAQEAGQGARSQPQGHQSPRSGPRVMTFNPATGRLE